MSIESIRIAVTDDHPLMLQGVCQLLEANPNMLVIGRYSSGDELLKGLAQQIPDILLLDINLPDTTGNALIRTIHRHYPTIKVIALTSLDTPFQVKDMMQHGCSGYLLKSSSPHIISEAVNNVYHGKRFIDPALQELLLQDAIGNTTDSKLTKREKEILAMICAGETNSNIAKKLFLSLRTIENHRFTLYRKFNVNNTAGLVKVALEQGLV